MKGEKRHSYRFKAFRLEVEERQLLHHDQPVPLTPKAFDVLVALVERSGHLVEKDELMQLVWSDSFVEEANLPRLVHTIRKVLGDDGNGNKFIETVAKKGYRFVTRVNKIEKPTNLAPPTGNGNYSPAVEKIGGSNLHHPAISENNGAAKLTNRITNPGKTAPKDLTGLILIVLIGSVLLAVAAWLILPRLFESRAPVFQSIQASRLTDSGDANSAEISPDGRFVAFIKRKDGKSSLCVRQVATGSVIALVPPATVDFYQPAFSPDGEFVYYVSIVEGIGTLFQVPTLGGESKKIIVDVDSKITFSPDGERFAFIRHNPTKGSDAVFIANRDGTNPEAFLNGNEIDYEQLFGVDWSFDGGKILLFLVKNERKPIQTAKVAAVSVSDKKLEILGDQEWIGVRNAEWTKDGTGIILVGKPHSNANYQIWHLDYPGGRARLITTDANNYVSVSLAADNKTMVAPQIEAISSLWSLDPQSKETNQLVSETPNLDSSLGLSQMPDGRIIYLKRTNNEVNIFSIDESGAGETRLTSNNGINYTPDVSSDGKSVVFVSNRNGSLAIWRMNADGSGAVQLSNDENSIDLEPQITPDGKTVIFSRTNRGGGSHKIMKVSIGGGDAVSLFPEDNVMRYSPRISHDGKRIAYGSFSYDSQAGSIISWLRFAEFDGEKIVSPETELKIVPPVHYKWTPDGKSLTYLSRKTGVVNLWTVSIESGEETPLTNFTVGNITNFHWSIDGRKVFIVKSIFNSNLVLIKDVAKSY